MNFPREGLAESIYPKVKHGIRVLGNIGFILDKLERDGNFRLVQDTFQAVIDKEVLFAIEELVKLERRSRKFNMKNQLRNNTYIFKENLKVVTGLVSGLSSRPAVEGQASKRIAEP